MFLIALHALYNCAFHGQRNPNLPILETIQHLLSCFNILPDPLPPLRTRILEEAGGDLPYYGNDVYADWSRHPYQFFRASGETVTSFNRLHTDLRPNIISNRQLDSLNVLLMTLWWMRRYPIYSEISVIFDIQESSVSRILNRMIPVLHARLHPEVVWPTNNEWQQLRGIWSRIPNAVGALDGTSHPIYRPTHNQRQYYSGHRHCHCYHTMVVMRNNFKIVMIRGGYSGHNNDAGIYRLMRRHVNLPQNLYLLADMGFPNGHPLLVPYRRRQLQAVRNTPLYQRRIAINKVIRKYRPRVENIIKHLKTITCISSHTKMLWLRILFSLKCHVKCRTLNHVNDA